MTTYNVTFIGDYWTLTTTHITDTKGEGSIIAEASEFVRAETGFAPFAQANIMEVAEVDAAKAEEFFPEHWVKPEDNSMALYMEHGACADCGSQYADEPKDNVGYCETCFRCTVCEPNLCG